MSIVRFIIVFLLSMLSLLGTGFATTIQHYQRIFTPVYDQQNRLFIAIRVFERDGVPSFLVVNSNTLHTEVKPVKSVVVRQQPTELSKTPYYRALQRYTNPPYRLQNQGMTHADKSVNGMILTIDMCPSRKPFEKNVFNLLVSKSSMLGKPIPVALAVSGAWILWHPSEFNWLVNQAKANKLDITWINHSYRHRYYLNRALRKNFLLLPDTNMANEILKTEKILLERDQLPSVFFRFPGLVSNEKIVKIVESYGLIPVGADAWLAKGQKPINGSIILIHGNGNEPAGIADFMRLFKKQKSNLTSLK